MLAQPEGVVQVPPENVTVVQPEPPAEVSFPTSFYCAHAGQQQQQQQQQYLVQATHPTIATQQTVAATGGPQTAMVFQPLQMTATLPSSSMAVDDFNEAKLGYVFLVLGWICCLAGFCMPVLFCFMGLWVITPLMHLCRHEEDRTRYPRARRAAKFNMASMLCILATCMMFIVAGIVCASEHRHDQGPYGPPHHHGPHHYGPHEPHHHGPCPHHGHHHHGHHENTTAAENATATTKAAAVTEATRAEVAAADLPQRVVHF